MFVEKLFASAVEYEFLQVVFVCCPKTRVTLNTSPLINFQRASLILVRKSLFCICDIAGWVHTAGHCTPAGTHGDRQLADGIQSERTRPSLGTARSRQER